MIEAAVLGFLAADPRVIAKVEDRLSPQPMPQAQLLPAITVLRISDLPGRDVRGQTGLNDARVQVDAWGKTLLEAQETADAVQAVLDPLPRDRRRRAPGVPLYIGEGARIDYARFLNQQDLPETDVQAPDPSTRIHRVSTDYRVRYARES